MVLNRGVFPLEIMEEDMSRMCRSGLMGVFQKLNFLDGVPGDLGAATEASDLSPKIAAGMRLRMPPSLTDHAESFSCLHVPAGNQVIGTQ